MHTASENLIVFQQGCELIQKKDEADQKGRQLMSLNLHFININGELIVEPTFDLKGPGEDPHYTARDLAQVNCSQN